MRTRPSVLDLKTGPPVAPWMLAIMKARIRSVGSSVINFLRSGRILQKAVNLWSSLLFLDSSRPPAAHAFYVVAHQDDWQLFMSESVSSDMRNEQTEKLIFVYVTAGDAGQAERQVQGRVPY